MATISVDADDRVVRLSGSMQPADVLAAFTATTYSSRLGEPGVTASALAGLACLALAAGEPSHRHREVDGGGRPPGAVPPPRSAART